MRLPLAAFAILFTLLLVGCPPVSVFDPDSGTGPDDGGAGVDGGGGPESLIHYMGRFDTTDPDHPVFAWSGSDIFAHFDGTGVSVSLSGSANEFEVIVDDGAPSVFVYDGHAGTHTLAKNLDAGEHTIELAKRTEASFGPVVFDGFGVLDGALVPSPERYARHIEFVGDSITCGYGDEGMLGPTCHWDTMENEFLAYGALTARALNASHTAIAWSGKGVVRNYGGDKLRHMPALFKYTIPFEDGGLPWDFSAAPFTPDVVVINLGTNDFSTGDAGVTSLTFEPAYTDFLETLRGVYPNAEILCAIGPMLPDSQLIYAKNDIQAAIADRVNAGDTRVQFLEFPEQDGGVGLGCDYHPNLIEHGLMADQLTAAIKTTMGW